jgi:Tol biopolymer transport system component
VGSSAVELRIHDLHTGTSKQLTHDHAWIMGHAWQGDRGAIVYSSNRQDGLFSLWRMRLDGTAPELLLTSATHLKYPAFSRDGRSLAYESWSYDTNLWSSAVDKVGDDRPLAASTRQESQPAIYAVDGALAFVSNRGGSMQLWLAQDEQEPRPVELPKGWSPSAPAWSPDGKALVFQVRHRAAIGVYEHSRSGGSPRRRIATRGNQLLPAFSADGMWIYYASDASGSWQIRRIATDSGRDRQLTSEGGYRAKARGAWLYFAPITSPLFPNGRRVWLRGKTTVP